MTQQSWGTNTVIPQRHAGDVLHALHFSPEIEPQTGQRSQRLVAYFRHRDERIWMARIVPVPPDNGRLIYPAGGYELGLQSSGCRTYRFLGQTTTVMQKTALRFANLPLPRYQRLVADAKGTLDFPVQGSVGFLQMACVQLLPAFQGEQRQQVGVSALGRWTGDQVILFPNVHELADIMGAVAYEGVHPLVPAAITEEQLAEAYPSFDTHDIREAIEQLSWYKVPADILIQALASHFYGTGEEGKPKPREREHRVIDIRDEEGT